MAPRSLYSERRAEGFFGSMVKADLDGDDDLDLAAADPSGRRIVTLHNDGHGVIQLELELSTAGPPVDLLASDLDGDSDLELVVANDGTVMTLNIEQPGRSLDWNHNAVPDECDGGAFHRGDATGDGRVGLTDAVALLEHLFRGGKSPACKEAADAQNDGALDMTSRTPCSCSPTCSAADADAEAPSHRALDARERACAVCIAYSFSQASTHSLNARVQFTSQSTSSSTLQASRHASNAG